MALIVNMDAPRNCSGCCLMGSPNCPYDGSKVMGSDYPNCPIIGEIPDSHGDLKDANIIMQWLNLKADNRVPVTVGEIIDFIEKQPTVLEATE